jgi:hypothetical protein
LELVRTFQHPNSFLTKEEFEKVYLGKEEIKKESKKGLFQRLFRIK